jgi:hypothetical protein
MAHNLDYETFRGDSIDVEVQFPGAALGDGNLRATLKSSLAIDPTDALAIWAANLDTSDTDIVPDPAGDIAYIHVPYTGTEDANVNSLYYLDVSFTIPGQTFRKTLQAKIGFNADGTQGE